VPASQWLKQPGNTLAPLVDSGGIKLDVAGTSRELDLASVETTLKYEGYLKQEASRAARLRREEKRRIPEGVVFAAIPGLSREVVQRLSQVRPETLGQASRIPGMTPAAIAVLGSFLGRDEADSSSHA
jgi:tRNA uridine 5-carboxymethylaminomethyl modification enzyme